MKKETNEYVMFVEDDILRDSGNKYVKITKNQCDYITVEQMVISKPPFEGRVGIWAVSTDEMKKNLGQRMEIGKDYYYWIDKGWNKVKIVEFVKTVK
jgi:hypothetical protein